MTNVTDKFQKKIMWKLRDGRSVSFWMDQWTPTEQPFFFNLAQANMIMDTTFKVKDMVNVEENWNN